MLPSLHNIVLCPSYALYAVSLLSLTPYLDCLVHVREGLVELPPVELVLALLHHHPHSAPVALRRVQGRGFAQHGPVVQQVRLSVLCGYQLSLYLLL